MTVKDLVEALQALDQTLDAKVEVNVASEIVTLDVSEVSFDEDALEVCIKTE